MKEIKKSEIMETKEDLKKIILRQPYSYFRLVNVVNESSDGIVICLNHEEFNGDDDEMTATLYDEMWEDDLSLEYPDDSTPILLNFNGRGVIPLHMYAGHPGGVLCGILDDLKANGGLLKLYYIDKVEGEKLIEKVFKGGESNV